MAIVPLDKMTLYGAQKQQAQVLEQLQKLGCAHLVNLGESGGDLAAGDVSHDARDALKYLRACRDQLRQVRRSEQFNREAIVKDALRIRDEQRTLTDEYDELRKAIKDLQPWGEFQLPPEGKIGDLRFWFYVVPLRQWRTSAESVSPAREVARDHQNAYVVLLSRDEPNNSLGTRVNLDHRPLSELQARLEYRRPAVGGVAVPASGSDALV